MDKDVELSGNEGREDELGPDYAKTGGMITKSVAVTEDLRGVAVESTPQEKLVQALKTDGKQLKADPGSLS